MELPEHAIVNETGQVAMRYKKQAPALVECGKKKYYFAVRANIALAWVDQEDLSCVLAKKEGCCGGRKKPAVFFADETHVRRWTVGGGR